MAVRSSQSKLTPTEAHVLIAYSLGEFHVNQFASLCLSHLPADRSRYGAAKSILIRLVDLGYLSTFRKLRFGGSDLLYKITPAGLAFVNSIVVNKQGVFNGRAD